MSDLYLELHSRIPVVAQQTHLGRQRLQDAQDAVGLSNEAIARKVPVSEKTWRRWKERGEIPTSALPDVAKALRLDLHQLTPAVADGELLERLQQLERLLESLSGRVDAGFQATSESLEGLVEAIDQLSPQRSAARPQGRRRQTGR